MNLNECDALIAIPNWRARLPKCDCRLVMRMAQNSGPLTRVASTMVAVLLVIAVTWLKSHPSHAPASPRGSAFSLPGAGQGYDLGRDETMGGHTLHRHVGRSDEQLRERLNEEREISAASTYSDRAAAERTVAAALAQNRARVESWVNPPEEHSNLTLQFRGNTSIGRTMRRGEQSSEPCSEALVVLHWDGEGRFHVITSYPEAYRGR